MLNPNDSSIKFNPRRDGEGDYRSSIQNPKSNSPAPSKPFKDLMDKGTGENPLGKQQLANRKEFLEEEDTTTLADVASDTPTPSIFEIGKKQARAKALKDAAAEPAPFSLKSGDEPIADAPPPSPATLYQTMTRNEPREALRSHVSNETANLEGKILPQPTKNAKLSPMDIVKDPELVSEQAIEQPAWKDKEKEKFASPFAAKEQPDLSYVNPLNQQAAQVERMAESVPQKPPVSPTLTAAQIVEQISQHIRIEEFKAQGITNTTVTLNYPNLFKDAQVILTSFDTAKKEFNITFQNLGVEAKTLLDQQATQDSLKHALEVKGYMVHIITATTTIDQPIVTDSGNQYRDARDDQQQQEGGDGRKRKREDEEQG